MAAIINWYPPNPAPTNLQATLSSGGSLAANTTYYYTVIACGNTSVNNSDFFIEGAAAEEVSVTTDSEKKTVSLSWNSVSGAKGYFVYRRKSNQPDYTFYGAQLAPSGAGVYTTSNNYFTDNGTCSTYSNRMIALNTVGNNNLPGNFDCTQGRGLLRVSSDSSGATITLQDLYNAVSDTNFCEYDGVNFNLLGTLYFYGSYPINFNPTGKNINLLGNFYQENSSSSSVFTFTHCNFQIYSHDFLRPSFSYKLTTFNKCKISAGRYCNPAVAAVGSGNGFYSVGWQVTNVNSAELKNSDLTALEFTPYNSDMNVTGCFFNVSGSGFTPSSRSYVYFRDNQAYYLDCLTAKVDYFKGWKIYGEGGSSSGTHLRISPQSGYYLNLVNAYFPDAGNYPKIYWYGSSPGAGNPRSYINLKYEFNLKVTDKEGNAISGASVKIIDYTGQTVADLTTNSSGEITTQNLIWVKLERNNVAGNYVTDAYPYTYTFTTYYTPHTVIISKNGYQIKTIKYTMDRERREIEILEKAIDFIIPMGKEIYKNLKPNDNQNKILWAKVKSG